MSIIYFYLCLTHFFSCAGDCGASGCNLLKSTENEVGNMGVKYRGGSKGGWEVKDGRMPFSAHMVVPSTEDCSDDLRFTLSSLREDCTSLLKMSKDTFWVGSDWKYSFDDGIDISPDASTPRKQCRCQLEDFALMIFHYHVKQLQEKGEAIESIETISGAEWWIQVKNAFDGAENEEDAMDDDHNICLHYDKDEDVAEKWDVGLFPPLSTVTYLSEDVGNSTFQQPTLIFYTTANDEVGSPINDAYMSFPRMGKHIAFDGSLLHGAPSQPSLCTWQAGNQEFSFSNSHSGTESPLRVTFLVNIWINHHPIGVNVLNLDYVDKLNAATTCRYKYNGTGKCTANENIKCLSLSESGDEVGVRNSASKPESKIALSSVLQIQECKDGSTASILVSSDDVYCEERDEERDVDAHEDDVLLNDGYEQLCLSFISSKQKDNGNLQECEDEESGLLLRMILPPASTCHANFDFPLDSFHLTYVDENCAPALEYNDQDDYSDRGDD